MDQRGHARQKQLSRKTSGKAHMFEICLVDRVGVIGKDALPGPYHAVSFLIG